MLFGVALLGGPLSVSARALMRALKLARNDNHLMQLIPWSTFQEYARMLKHSILQVEDEPDIREITAGGGSGEGLLVGDMGGWR